MEVVRRFIRQCGQCLHNFAAIAIGLLGVERRPDLIREGGAVLLQPSDPRRVMAGNFSIFVGFAAEKAASFGLELDNLTHGIASLIPCVQCSNIGASFSENSYF
jgi:hypothetical protein